jgi:hypothetical protein
MVLKAVGIAIARIAILNEHRRVGVGRHYAKRHGRHSVSLLPERRTTTSASGIELMGMPNRTDFDLKDAVKEAGRQ